MAHHMTEKTISTILGKLSKSSTPFEDSLRVMGKIMTSYPPQKALNNTQCQTFVSAKDDMLAIVYFNDEKPYSIDVFSENADWGIHVINFGINRAEPKISITVYKPSNIDNKRWKQTYLPLFV
jgi:hypothetical protein